MQPNPKPDLSKRTTQSDLLLAGWHNVWSEETGSRWVHPRFDMQVPFNTAVKVLNRLGVDAYGEMNAKGE